MLKYNLTKDLYLNLVPSDNPCMETEDGEYRDRRDELDVIMGSKKEVMCVHVYHINGHLTRRYYSAIVS